MKLYVKIIAFSEENGVKSTREEVVEIPPKVVKLNEVVMGNDPGAIVDGFATSAFAAAIQTVQSGGQNQAQNILTGDTGRPIGAGHSAQEGGKKDPLASSLGLDIIEAMDAREAHQRPNGPGPIGFGPHRRS